jgi:hypothetical protein
MVMSGLIVEAGGITIMARFWGIIVGIAAGVLVADALAQTTSFYGAYDVFPMGSTGSPTTRFLIRPSNPGFFISGMGQPWTGQGQFNGRSGFYDWKFPDGRAGRTDFTVYPDGSLQGHLVGAGIDSQFIARHEGGVAAAAPRVQPGHPLVMTPEQLNEAMAGSGPTWNCPDGSKVTVNPAPPVAVIYGNSECTFTFIEGRTSSVSEGNSCNLGLSAAMAGLIKMHQSVSISGPLVRFWAQQASGGLAPALNTGTGATGGTFNTTSGQLHVNGGKAGSASALTCRKQP